MLIKSEHNPPSPKTRLVEFDGSEGIWFQQLVSLLEPFHGLSYSEFVNYFYCSEQQCRLNLLVDDCDEILGVLGHEVVPFNVDGRVVRIGFGSNFRAFQPGAGGILFLNWLKQCQFGLIFGGSPDTHRLLDPRRWTTYPGVGQFELNAPYAENPSDSWWRSFAKNLLQWSPTRRRIDHLDDLALRAESSIRIVEEKIFTSDIIPVSSPFDLRMVPNIDWLNWRYNTQLSFVNYRLFRILRDDESVGYVVLNEQRLRVLVAHSDADDALTLARGTLAAIKYCSTGSRRRQGVIVTAANSLLRDVYSQIGFTERVPPRPFVIGSLLKKPDWSDDTSNWLVNFDWCDNGLRPPFLGHSQLGMRGAA